MRSRGKVITFVVSMYYIDQINLCSGDLRIWFTSYSDSRCLLMALVLAKLPVTQRILSYFSNFIPSDPYSHRDTPTFDLSIFLATPINFRCLCLALAVNSAYCAADKYYCSILACKAYSSAQVARGHVFQETLVFSGFSLVPQAVSTLPPGISCSWLHWNSGGIGYSLAY